MTMTYDQALPALLGEVVPSLTSGEVCVIRDLQGRLRLVVESMDAADRSALEDKLRDVLGGYFVGPILLRSGDDKVQRQLAGALWAQKQPWPTTWPEDIQDTLSGAKTPVDRGRFFALTKALSKDEWLSAPPAPPWSHNSQTPPIVSFYSFKGGVGRSTLLGCVAYALAKQGKQVCILDLDLEAPGIGTLLQAQSDRGLLDVIIDYIATGTINLVGCSARALSFGALADKVTVIPAGTVTDWRYLEKLARLDFAAQSASPGSPSPVHRALSEILKTCKKDLAPSVFLLDSRAGLHDLGGLSLHALSHIEVLVARKSEQNYRGMELALQALARRNLATLRCLMVHGFAPVRNAPSYRTETEAFRETIYDLFSRHVYSKTGDEVPGRDDTEALHYPQDFPQTDALAQASVLTEAEVPDLSAPAMQSLMERFEFLLKGPEPT
jgi:MinD-like ATPase involved in chromosome partitioning or flagellar assembly